MDTLQKPLPARRRLSLRQAWRRAAAWPRPAGSGGGRSVPVQTRLLPGQKQTVFTTSNT